MLSFGRTTDYSLISLAHLAGLEGRTVCAREIAASYRLSAALVMKVLKALHRAGIIDSQRGSKGGYRLSTDLHELSLFDLMAIMRRMDGEFVEAAQHWRASASDSLLPTEPALLAVRSKLNRFLKEVKLSDLVVPGRRIDVPVELVGRRKMKNEPTAALVG